MIQIDEIGTLYEPARVDAQGVVLGNPPALQGWHVNASHPVEAWADQRVTPAAPRRVFSGAETAFYSFASQSAFARALESADLNPPAPEPVPASVTMRQARLALLGAGMLATVNAAIAAMPGAQGEAARIEWEFSSEVKRGQALVTQLGPVLGLTSAQLNALFVAAAAL